MLQCKTTTTGSLPNNKQAGSITWFNTSHKMKMETPKFRVLLRYFRGPIRVTRIENWVSKIKGNYHRVPKIREIRSLQVYTMYLTFSFEKNCPKLITQSRNFQKFDVCHTNTHSANKFISTLFYSHPTGSGYRNTLE